MGKELLQYKVWIKSLKTMASTADWYLIEQSGCIATHGPMRGVKREDENDHIILKCLGHKTKKGDLVFEGDIIQLEEFNWRVYFGRTSFDGNSSLAWCVENQKGFNHHLDDSILKGNLIGNIYENPELSKVEEHNALAGIEDVAGFMEKVKEALQLVDDFACNFPTFFFEPFETEEGDTVDSPSEQVKNALALFPNQKPEVLPEPEPQKELLPCDNDGCKNPGISSWLGICDEHSKEFQEWRKKKYGKA